MGLFFYKLKTINNCRYFCFDVDELCSCEKKRFSFTGVFSVVRC